MAGVVLPKVNIHNSWFIPALQNGYKAVFTPKAKWGIKTNNMKVSFFFSVCSPCLVQSCHLQT